MVVTPSQLPAYAVSLTFASIAVCVAVETGRSERAASEAAHQLEVSDKSNLSSVAGVIFGVSVGKIMFAMVVFVIYTDALTVYVVVFNSNVPFGSKTINLFHDTSTI